VLHNGLSIVSIGFKVESQSLAIGLSCDETNELGKIQSRPVKFHTIHCRIRSVGCCLDWGGYALLLLLNRCRLATAELPFGIEPYIPPDIGAPDEVTASSISFHSFSIQPQSVADYVSSRSKYVQSRSVFPTSAVHSVGGLVLAPLHEIDRSLRSQAMQNIGKDDAKKLTTIASRRPHQAFAQALSATVGQDTPPEWTELDKSVEIQVTIII
jgi:hypothetical protein